MSQFNRATLANAFRSQRVAIYCRVSSAGQEDNSSLELAPIGEIGEHECEHG